MDGDAREGMGGVTWVPKRSRRCVCGAWDVGCGAWYAACEVVNQVGTEAVAPLCVAAAVDDGMQMFSVGARWYAKCGKSNSAYAARPHQ